MKAAIHLFILLPAFAPGGNAQLNEQWKYGVFQIKNETNSTEGCGFYIGNHNDSSYLITAKHVVTDEGLVAKKITVQDQQEKKYEAVVIKVHETEDVALVSFKATALSPVKYLFVVDACVQLEVYFFSMKYNIILPSNIPGVIRKADFKKTKFIVEIDGVEQGDSGSPLFCERGIAAMIITNGMVKAINIMRIREIVVEEWEMGAIWKLFSTTAY